jgi:hypothetical protein
MEILNYARAASVEAARSAETYVFFAMPYWYYQKDWNNGQAPVTFYNGYPQWFY